jgi:hypothetical protein
MTLVNLADWKVEPERFLTLAAAVAVAAGCFGVNIWPKAVSYPEKCKTYEAYYDSLRAVLDAVPDEASVAATTFYTTYLSQRDELYDIRYASKDHIFSCEYMALSVTDTNSYKKFAVNGEMGFDNFVKILLDLGYEKIAEYEGRLEIYRKIPG